MDLLLQLACLAVLLVCSAFCSSSESAYFSLNPLDIRRIVRKKPSRGEQIHRILGSPTSLLSAILIGNTAVNTVASTLGYSIAERLFPHHGHTIAIPAMTALLLIFGEVGPKRIGLLYNEWMAIHFVPAVRGLMLAAAGPRVLLEFITRRFEPMFRPRGRTLSQEEFETVVDISREQGVINGEEIGMVKAVIRLDQVRVSEVMVPRVDLIGIEATQLADRLLDVALSAKVHFILVYRGSLDNIEALVDVRKYLLDPDHRIESARTAPAFVPASCPLSRLLAQFQREHKRIAVVVDEYGGTAGLVTRGDILEQIAGDVYEEMGKPRPVFQQAGPERWIVDAGFSLDELNRKLRLRLQGAETNRLSGWIVERAGRIPAANEVIEAQGCRITVLKTAKTRVTLAQIEKVEGAA